MSNAAKDLLGRFLNPNGPFGTQINFKFDVHRNRAFIAGKWRTIQSIKDREPSDQDKARLRAAEEKRYNRRVRRQPGT